MTAYRRKPEVVSAMLWDGSKESYMAILRWITPFLPKYTHDGITELTTCWCEYWDAYNEPPPDRTDAQMDDLRLTEQEFDWRYRMIKFEAANGDQEMDANRWIVFRPGEEDLPDAEIVRPEEFEAKYELKDDLDRLKARG